MIFERGDSDTEPTATLTNPGENAVGYDEQPSVLLNPRTTCR